MLDREVVERLGELLTKATPGPWRADSPEDYCDAGLVIEAEGNECVLTGYTWAAEEDEALAEQRRRDVGLVVAAVNALPELLRVYRAWLGAPVVELTDCNNPLRQLPNNPLDVTWEDFPTYNVRLVRDGDSGEG